MRLAVKGLQLRHKTYHFRRLVPEDLRDTVGQREWKKSLGLAEHQKAAAAVAAEQLWAETDSLISKLRAEQNSQKPPIKLAKEAAEWAAEHELLDGQAGRIDRVEVEQGREYHFDSEASLAFDHIIEEAAQTSGVDHNGHPLSLSPEQQAKLAVLKAGAPVTPSLTVRDAIQVYADEHCGGSLDKATAQSSKQFLDMVGDIELEKLSRPMVSKWLRQLVDEREQSKSTVRRRIGAMKAVINYAIDNHNVDIRNPFNRQKPPKHGAEPIERAPLHARHLALIDSYLEDDAANADTRSILTLLKYTGCRPLEIGGISRAEINLTAEQPFIRLASNKVRRLKNAAAARLIPLLGGALAATEEALRRSCSDYVFPEDCWKTNSLSQRLKTTMRKAGVPVSRRLVPYSYRHTMIEALKLAEVSEDVRRDLTGHADNSSAANYGAEKRPMPQLIDGLQRGLERLGDVEASEYLPGELPD